MVLPQWTFPVNNSRTNPGYTQAFGSVHLGDLVVLEWTPASASPVVLLFCQNPAGGFDFRKIDTSTSPSLYVVNYASTAASIKCSFAMNDTNGDGSTYGGTNPFTYIPQRGASVATFSASASATTSLSLTSSQSSSTSTSTSASGTGTTSSGSTISASNSSPTTSSGSSSSTASPSTSSGLSTGAKAGIAVGVILGVVLIAAMLLACLCIRRSRRRREVQNSHNHSGPGPVELSTENNQKLVQSPGMAHQYSADHKPPPSAPPQELPA